MHAEDRDDDPRSDLPSIDPVLRRPSGALMRLTVQHEGRGYDLWQRAGDEERRVLDLDLARWAEMKNPSNILAMLDRYGEDLASMGDLYRLEIAPPARGGKARVASYLSEAQALYLLAKMETPKAKKMLKTMIAVFLAVQRGAAAEDLLRAQRQIEDGRRTLEHAVRSNAQLSEKHGEVVRERDALLIQLAGMAGATVTPWHARWLNRMFREIADRRSFRSHESWREAHGAVQEELREALDFDSGSWDGLPMTLWGKARRSLERAFKRAHRKARKRGYEGRGWKANQQHLPLVEPPTAPR